MFHVQTVDHLDDPRLLPYRTMKQQRDHFNQRLFVAEGEKVVRRLLESNLVVISLALPEKWLAPMAPFLEPRPENVAVFVVEKTELEKLTGFSMYQGLLAVGRIPDSASLDVVLATSAQPYLLAAVDGLNNSENLGALVRNCAAFGVQALLVGETCSSPYLRRAVRSSMGTIFTLPVVETTCLAQSLRTLRQHHVWSVAAHPHAYPRSLSQARLAPDACLVFGSEGFGLSADVLAACDDQVAIPMQAGVDSLNVASASAAFLYEAARQRAQA
jgi:tRNA G18 (ribose-2'-O)-methylase SpoU